MDFLDYYRENLGYLRTLGAEFAAEFPKIAARLDLSAFECQDPYVERLLEGTAFLAARVEKKLDDGYGRLLESVLGSVSPDALNPVASGAVLELRPDLSDDRVKKGGLLKEGTSFDAVVPTVNTPCRFSTLWNTPLTALVLTDAEYVTRDLTKFIPDAAHPAALRLKFSLPAKMLFSEVSVPELMLFLNLPEAPASLLLRQLTLDVGSVYVSADGSPFDAVPGVRFEMPAAATRGDLFGGVKGNLNGLRVLQNFLAYPAFFKFALMKNSAGLFDKEASEIEIIVGFNRREAELTNEVKPSALKLNCAPVLNLFKKRSDRVFLDKTGYEFHVVPDRTAARDYEVFSIRRLEFFGEKNETLFSATNFYDEDLSGKNDKRNFFSLHRRRSLFNQKALQRSSYTGTEVFVSLTGDSADSGVAAQFCAELICTNRDLPLLLTGQTALSCADAVIQSAGFAVTPTRPDYPLIEKGGASDWAKVGHILFNLSGMLWQDGTFPLEMLKTLLRNYNLRSSEEMERMLDGIVELDSEPTAFRFIKNGAVFFESGWRVRFVLDEQAYAGVGFYLFAAVLKEILFSFTPLNSLLEVQFFTRQSGKIAVWKMLEN